MEHAHAFTNVTADSKRLKRKIIIIIIKKLIYTGLLVVRACSFWLKLCINGGTRRRKISYCCNSDCQ